jgi:hypothetical protein
MTTPSMTPSENNAPSGKKRAATEIAQSDAAAGSDGSTSSKKAKTDAGASRPPEKTKILSKLFGSANRAKQQQPQPAQPQPRQQNGAPVIGDKPHKKNKFIDLKLDDASDEESASVVHSTFSGGGGSDDEEDDGESCESSSDGGNESEEASEFSCSPSELDESLSLNSDERAYELAEDLLEFEEDDYDDLMRPEEAIEDGALLEKANKRKRQLAEEGDGSADENGGNDDDEDEDEIIDINEDDEDEMTEEERAKWELRVRIEQQSKRVIKHLKATYQPVELGPNALFQLSDTVDAQTMFEEDADEEDGEMAAAASCERSRYGRLIYVMPNKLNTTIKNYIKKKQQMDEWMSHHPGASEQDYKQSGGDVPKYLFSISNQTLKFLRLTHPNPALAAAASSSGAAAPRMPVGYREVRDEFVAAFRNELGAELVDDEQVMGNGRHQLANIMARFFDPYTSDFDGIMYEDIAHNLPPPHNILNVILVNLDHLTPYRPSADFMQPHSNFRILS